MKAPDFAYARPADLGAALALLAEHGTEAQPLAGGQSLMPMMNFRLAAPEILIDLSDVAELRGLERTRDTVRIGAMTRYRDLEDWPDLGGTLPLVAMALPHIAHDAIRNRGTIGGSIALCDPAAELPAVMRVLAAEIEVAGAEGSRRVAADDFFTGFYETACGEEELIVAIHVPVAEADRVYGFHELAQRHGDYAMAGVALSALSPNPIRSLRAAFFGIAATPVRLPDLEAALEGLTACEAQAAVTAALEGLDLLADTKASADMRRHLSGVVLKRALEAM
ncbi:FAD binding domain-containing protein [Histidinibacterium lentulum]|uniref:Xanthine dehydrogenase family protein subunit M n=1 Tax=Histidinibacterium lentulum TaxID=2480588 RepID=A0A3N2RA01_9RHOB|nr:FAD binding domain-containing protein [Histidinibacterium lentulum]ROU04231.1 xanthine dehydrogenase family protein subunit M [Histidinibacterium lentulum]